MSTACVPALRAARDERLADVKMREQLQGVPGVLGGDYVRVPEGLQRAERDVAQIANRRPDDIQR